MSTRNDTDLEQRAENLQRVRRDKLTSPGVAPAGYIETGGNVSAVPGDQAPFARVPPFVTEVFEYGITTPMRFILGSREGIFPLLNVESWRFITFSISYTVREAFSGSQLSITPYYGDALDNFSPRFVKSDAITVDDTRAYHTLYQEEFRSPVITTFDAGVNIFYGKITFDVAPFKAIYLDAMELNQDAVCPEGADPDTCNLLRMWYSLSM